MWNSLTKFHLTCWQTSILSIYVYRTELTDPCWVCESVLYYLIWYLPFSCVVSAVRNIYLGGSIDFWWSTLRRTHNLLSHEERPKTFMQSTWLVMHGLPRLVCLHVRPSNRSDCPRFVALVLLLYHVQEAFLCIFVVRMFWNVILRTCELVMFSSIMRAREEVWQDYTFFLSNRSFFHKMRLRQVFMQIYDEISMFAERITRATIF